jgi:hypothetical protein
MIWQMAIVLLAVAGAAYFVLRRAVDAVRIALDDSRPADKCGSCAMKSIGGDGPKVKPLVQLGGPAKETRQ